MKAYALQDLHQLGEAKATLQQALKLSPFNAQYLAELGEINAPKRTGQKPTVVSRSGGQRTAFSTRSTSR